MSTTQSRETTEDTVRITGFFSGRSELVVTALLLALAVALTIGTASMNVMGDTVPGPQFFPWIICIVLYALTVLHGLSVLRTRRFPQGTESGNPDFSAEMLAELGDTQRTEVLGASAQRPRRTGRVRLYSDWATIAWIVGGIACFILVLPVLGWIISAAGLFWAICKALGSTRPIFDIGVAAMVSSISYLAFGLGLGLSLPAGLLGGLL